MVDPRERRYLERARVGRLATADSEGRPSVVPVCFALDGEDGGGEHADGVEIVSAIDEKPQDVAATDLRRVRDIEANPRVTLVVDHYVEDWSRLGWVQVRGTASVLEAGDDGHGPAVEALEEKYEQYRGPEHSLSERPVVRIAIGSVRSWGSLEEQA